MVEGPALEERVCLARERSGLVVGTRGIAEEEADDRDDALRGDLDWIADCAPARRTSPGSDAQLENRDKDVPTSEFHECLFRSPSLSLSPSLFLSRRQNTPTKEATKIPAARAALDAELENPPALRAWLPGTVAEHDEVCNKAGL